MNLPLLFHAAILLVQPAEQADFFRKGTKIWVAKGMADGYKLPFGQCLTIRKARKMFMKEVRIVFEEYPERRFYLRSDFGPNYAFRRNPREVYDFTPEEWESIRRGDIRIGMSKRLFLCIKPLAEEIYYQPNPEGPIEQWVYRDKPKSLYGARSANPPSQIFFFQNDVLIHVMES